MTRYSNMRKSLTSPVFESEVDMSVFSGILDALDHVIPEYISREEFIEKNGDFLQKNETVVQGQFYTLFLPKDLQYIELLSIIDVLDREFDLGKFSKFEELLVSTKTAVGKILKEGGNEEKVEEYIQKSGISPELQKRIEEVDIIKHMSVAKKVLKQHEDDQDLEEVMADIFGEEFEKIFLRRGVNMLRFGLMTFTHSDFKEIGEEWVDMNRDKMPSFDEEERLLRKKIDIDEWKENIQIFRDQGRDDMTKFAEEGFVRHLLEILKNYPYQNTPAGYKPSQMLENKNVQCLGFSLIGHAFLVELGIEHSIVGTVDHSFLRVETGDKTYAFDPVDNFHQFGHNKDEEYPSSKDIGSSLLSQIYSNIASQGKGDVSTDISIGYLERSIKFDPQNINACIGLSAIYARVGKVEQAINMAYRAIDASPQAIDVYLILASNFLGVSQDNILVNEALKLSNLAEKIDTEHPVISVIRIGVYTHKRDYGAAENECNILFKEHPYVTQTYFLRAQVFFRKLYGEKGPDEYEKHLVNLQPFFDNMDREGLEKYLLSI